MRRLLAAVTVCLLLAGVLWTTAFAESAATRVDLLCTVNTDGECLVSANVLLRLEAAYDDFFFPVPANAKNITMNGSSVQVNRGTASADVDISKITRGYTGEANLRFEYTVPKVVQVGADHKLHMDLPLLCGFRYPVENLSFTVTMPTGRLSTQPHFTSIYRQDSIEADLKWEIRGSQIIGSSINPMNDHEGVNMLIDNVPKEMFPGVSTYVREGNPELTPMIIFAGLAMLYWILFLRTAPLIPVFSAAPPAGIAAGELGCHLTLSGGDLTGMVFSWAQMGYLLIHVDGSGRVLLHKRMDMGNERSIFENKIYHALFGGRRVVDATGLQYAQLSRKVAGSVPNERSMYKGNSGNVKIFRLLICVSQMLCGVCVAMNMTSVRPLQMVLAVFLAPFGAVSGWLLQNAAYRTHLRGKKPIWAAFGLIAVWIVLGLLSGQVWIPLGCSVIVFLLGYFAAYGGRRSELGRHDAALVLGFRRYLKRLPNAETSRILKNDPDFFFNYAPYALALGVIKPFARSFSHRKLDQCPYLITRVHGKRTADEWARLMIQTASLMDSRAATMELEKWVNVSVKFTRK